VTKKTYSVGKIKQLIDLNGESTNFDAHFRIVSKNKEPFEILVVDQTTLDNNPNLEYKKADGEISGNIVHDKNVYQNYFIILKADQPCECEVEITKKELPKTPDMPVQKLPAQTKKSNNTFSWINIIIIVGGVVIVGIVFYYMYFVRSSGYRGDSPMQSRMQSPVHSRVQSPMNSPRYQESLKHDLGLPSPRGSVVSRGEVVPSAPIGSGGNAVNKMLERLKSLKM
jgi:hypothetical protein